MIKNSKNGYTLIELIVSLVLVTVIILGIVAINMSLTENNMDYGQRYLVRSQTQATLNHILNNVSLAVGSVQGNDEGILISPAGNTNTFCIHQAGTGTPGGQNLINSNAANGIWLCYSWLADQISWCAEKYTVGADPRGATSCANAIAGGTAIAYNGNNQTFLGTAFSSFAGIPPTYSATNGFSITIQNCLNDAAASCNATGTSTDPANNPEVQVTGNVFPPQYSTG